jgi:predicted ArsR family transcriptional regulator
MKTKETNEDREKRILDLLKKNGEMSTGRISSYTGINFFKIEQLLESLKQKKEVTFRQDTRGIYWKLKELKR